MESPTHHNDCDKQCDAEKQCNDGCEMTTSSSLSLPPPNLTRQPNFIPTGLNQPGAYRSAEVSEGTTSRTCLVRLSSAASQKGTPLSATSTCTDHEKECDNDCDEEPLFCDDDNQGNDDNSNNSNSMSVNTSTDIAEEEGEREAVVLLPEAYVVGNTSTGDCIGNMYATIPYDVPRVPAMAIAREGIQKEIVNSILNRSSNNATNTSKRAVVTVIQGMGGLGKSTLAALILQQQQQQVPQCASLDIQRYFNEGGIAWIKLEHNTKLTPVTYRNHLLKMCSHLSLTINNRTNDTIANDDTQTNPNRNLATIFYESLSGFAFGNPDDPKAIGTDFNRLYNIFISFITKIGRALIVLDDLWYKEDLDLFCFQQQQQQQQRHHILATTRQHNIVEGTYSMNYDHSSVPNVFNLALPSGKEAVEILENVTEKQNLKDSPASKELVEFCGRLPIAITAVGQVIKGNDFMQQQPMTIEQTLEFLKRSSSTDDDDTDDSSDINDDDNDKLKKALFKNRTYAHVLNKTFETYGVTSTSMKKCFALFCICFCGSYSPHEEKKEIIRRPLIPRGAVYTLFDELFLPRKGKKRKRKESFFTDTEVIQLDKMRRTFGLSSISELIVYTLKAIGVIDEIKTEHTTKNRCSRFFIRTHHDLQQQYGIRYATTKMKRSSIKNHDVKKYVNSLLVQGYEKRAAQAAAAESVYASSSVSSVPSSIQSLSSTIKTMNNCDINDNNRKKKKLYYDWNNISGDDKEYMFENLVIHALVASEGNSEEKARKILFNSNFLLGRVNTLGPKKILDLCIHERYIFDELEKKKNKKKVLLAKTIQHNNNKNHLFDFKLHLKVLGVLISHFIEQSSWASKNKENDDHGEINNYNHEQMGTDSNNDILEDNEDSYKMRKWFLSKYEGPIQVFDDVINNNNIIANCIRSSVVKKYSKVHRRLVDAQLGDTSVALFWESVMLTWNRKYKEAMKRNHKLLKLAEDKCGLDNIALTTHNAFIHYCSGSHDKSIYICQKAIQLWKTSSSQYQYYIISTTNNLSSSSNHEGSNEKIINPFMAGILVLMCESMWRRGDSKQMITDTYKETVMVLQALGCDTTLKWIQTRSYALHDQL